MGALPPQSMPRSARKILLQTVGGVRKSLNCRRLDGRTYDEFPARTANFVSPESECLRLASEIETGYSAAALVQLAAPPFRHV